MEEEGNSCKSILGGGESPIWIQEDLPKKLREDNRLLQKIARTARMHPQQYNEVQVRDFMLTIDDQSYNAMEVWDLPEELTPEWVFTPRSDDAVAFFTKFSPLSNHFQCAFKIEGITYNCVEQYLAFKKASLAEDQALMDSAMYDKEPADYQVILNKLKYLPIEDWRDRARKILPGIIRAKFSQNRKLAKFLKDTNPLKIGEASKDTFWGTGITLKKRRCLIQKNGPKTATLWEKLLPRSDRNSSITDANKPTLIIGVSQLYYKCDGILLA